MLECLNFIYLSYLLAFLSCEAFLIFGIRYTFTRGSYPYPYSVLAFHTTIQYLTVTVIQRYYKDITQEYSSQRNAQQDTGTQRASRDLQYDTIYYKFALNFGGIIYALHRLLFYQAFMFINVPTAFSAKAVNPGIKLLFGMLLCQSKVSLLNIFAMSGTFIGQVIFYEFNEDPLLDFLWLIILFGSIMLESLVTVYYKFVLIKKNKIGGRQAQIDLNTDNSLSYKPTYMKFMGGSFWGQIITIVAFFFLFEIKQIIKDPGAYMSPSQMIFTTMMAAGKVVFSLRIQHKVEYKDLVMAQQIQELVMFTTGIIIAQYYQNRFYLSLGSFFGYSITYLFGFLANYLRFQKENRQRTQIMISWQEYCIAKETSINSIGQNNQTPNPRFFDVQHIQMQTRRSLPQSFDVMQKNQKQTA